MKCQTCDLTFPKKHMVTEKTYSMKELALPPGIKQMCIDCYTELRDYEKYKHMEVGYETD